MKPNLDDLELVERVKQMIKQLYSNHLTYEDFTQELGTNKDKLKKIFKAVTGFSVYDYITKVRVERAIYLLETTHLPIRQIAARVGLDKSNLAKRFKKFTGKTPSEWRREPSEELADQ
jgi:two-component system response regulator YesN